MFGLRLCAQLPPNPIVFAIANSASGSATIGPNTWVTIYGENLALPGDVRPWTASDLTNNQMPTSLDGISATFSNGERGFVSFISPNQIKILTPTDLTQSSLLDGYGVTVEVDFVGVGPPIPGCSTLATYSGSCYNAYAPCLSGETCDGNIQGFTCGGNGTCSTPTSYASVSPALFILYPFDVIAEHADGTLVNSASPAAPGEEIVLYAEGLGAVSPPVIPGSAVQVGALVKTPKVEIGGLWAVVAFAGLVSPGLYQVNFVVPPNVTPGATLLVIYAEGASSQPGVLLMVD